MSNTFITGFMINMIKYWKFLILPDSKYFISRTCSQNTHLWNTSAWILVSCLDATVRLRVISNFTPFENWSLLGCNYSFILGHSIIHFCYIGAHFRRNVQNTEISAYSETLIITYLTAWNHFSEARNLPSRTTFWYNSKFLRYFQSVHNKNKLCPITRINSLS
jgi:hypothetical protein